VSGVYSTTDGYRHTLNTGVYSVLRPHRTASNERWYDIGVSVDMGAYGHT